MKRKVRLIVLLCVLVVAVGAAVAVSTIEEQREAIRESGEVVLEIPTDDATALSWEYEDTSLSFRDEGEGWLYDGDEAFPVDDEKISELLEPFSAMSAAFTIEDVTDYGQYGLEDPLCTIEITAGGTDYTISVGDYSSLDYQRYVSTGDGNVYLVADDPMDYYSCTLDDLILNDTIPSFGGATAVSFEGEENYEIVRDESGEYSYRADDVYFTERGGEYVPLDTSKVDTYLQLINTLALDDYATYNATDEEIAEYGLDSPELTVTVEYPERDETGEETGESLTFALSVSRAAADKSSPWDEDEAEEAASDYDSAEATETPSDEDAVAYVRVGDSQIIYIITYDTFRSLMSASYNDLRHAEVLSAEFEDVAAIDITLEGEEYAITSALVEEDGEEQRVFYLGGEEISISSLESALTALSASEFTDEEPGGALEIALTATLVSDEAENGESAGDDVGEEAAAGPSIEIELYRVDGESCLAVVDGESFALVPRSSAVDLIEAVNAIVLG